MQEKLLAHESTIATHEQLIVSVAKDRDTQTTKSKQKPAATKVSRKTKKRRNTEQLHHDSSSSDYSDSEESDALSSDDESDQVCRLRRHSLPDKLVPQKPHFESSKSLSSVRTNTKAVKVAAVNAKSHMHSGTLKKASFSSVVKNTNSAHGKPTKQRNSNQSSFKPVSKKTRTDREGFTTPRKQWKRDNRTNTTTKKVFLYNVMIDDSVDDIRAYLQKHNIPYIDLKQTSHPDARSKSFAITVLESQFDNTLQDTTWPFGVKAREFREKRMY